MSELNVTESRIRPPFSPPDCPWVSIKPDTTLPKEAYNTGGTLQGEPVYIGRVYDDGVYLVGTALPSKGICLYLNKKQEIYSTNSYDILTVDCGQPLEWLPMGLDSNLLFVCGGDQDTCLYGARVVDGENTYIGWADKEIKSVFIPRDKIDGPNKLTENYDILIHQYLDRLCICPMPPF